MAAERTNRAVKKEKPSLGPLMAGCTIVTRETVAQAKILARSFRRFHPASPFFALLLDREPLTAKSSDGIEWLSLADLALEPDDLRSLPIICTAAELALAVKPALLQTCLQAKDGVIIYFDPEIQIFAALNEIAELTDKHSLVLFPYVTTPASVDLPVDGVYDTGLIALAGGSEPFLTWWRDRVKGQTYQDPARLRLTEQLSLDSAPTLFPRHWIIRAPEWNASHRNLPGHEIVWTGDRYEMSGEPLCLFHFAGYDPAKPHLLSVQQGHEPRVLLSREPALAKLCAEYREKLLSAGFEENRPEANAFDSWPGLKIDRHIRRLYRETLAEFRKGIAAEPPSPFDRAGIEGFRAWLNEPIQSASYPITRYLLAIYNSREDLASSFPDPLGLDAAAFFEWFVLYGCHEEQTDPALVPAEPPAVDARSGISKGPPNEQINVAGYFRAELGIGEAARLLLKALDASHTAYRAIPYGGTVSRQDHPFDRALKSAAMGDINLVCINADQFPRFARQSEKLFLPGRYTIGVWFWEVEDFPAELHASFDYVDEVWGASEFIRQTFAKVSPKPVFKFPLPIVAPEIDASLSRDQLGLPGRFSFLFSFDFLSVLERKNPVGLIDAFKRAFRPGEGPALVIKTINGDKRLLAMEKLLFAAADHPDVIIRDGYISAVEKNSLTALCDCYISLHRSEGYGLTSAEAMALGRPTIATGYSGNLDFMNAENSFLCSYTTRQIGPGAEPYPDSSHWAEPDLDEAAELMRRVYFHPEEAQERAKQALSDIDRLHSPAVAGKTINSRLAMIRQQRPFKRELAAARLAKRPMTSKQLRDALASAKETAAALRRTRREARAAQSEADLLSARLAKAEQEAWDNKVRRAAVTARLQQRDQALQQIHSSPIWKAAKPLWKFHRHLRGEESKGEKVAREELLFAIDAPADWTTSREIVVVRGWCFARGSQALAGVRAKIGKKSYLARYGMPRTDLMASYPAFPQVSHAGFSIEIKPVPKGVSSVRLEAIVQGQDWEPFFEHELVRTSDPNEGIAGEDSPNGSEASPLRSERDRPAPQSSLTLYPGLRRAQLLRALEPLFERHAKRAAADPFFSIITPTHNTKLQWLAEAAASLLQQSFADWEWCIVDDGSKSRELREMLKTFAGLSSHVRVKFVPLRGISSANNYGLEMARGDYVCFLDHDDLLEPEALASMAERIDESFDAVYSDEDKLDEERGELVEHFFKPDWSPEYFRGVMYVGHLLCVRRELAAKVRFDSAFDGVQDFEFMLRVSETGAKIGHIPRILYHWRKTPGSIAEKTDAKPRIAMLQAEAVTNHLARVGLRARAEQSSHPHRLKIVPLDRSVFPAVSIIIPTKDAPELLERCLKSISEKTFYRELEVIVMDNETTDAEALRVMEEYPVRRLSFPNPFNFSRANNLGAQQAAGEFLLFLNNDTQIVAEDWLQQLLYYAEQPDVGAVGALLLYENRTVQHAGVALGMRGTADHTMRGFPSDVDGYAGSLACAREVSAVTAACLMMRKSLFFEIGGFNEHFFTAYQDVDLCLRLRERGLRIIHTPRAIVLHHESVSRKSYYDMVDRMLLLDRWEPVIERGDPYYNPNLALELGDYSRRS